MACYAIAMHITTPFVRLALRVQAGPLLQEATAFRHADWSQHFNADYHDGGWQGVALRAIDGDGARLFSDPARRAAVANTALLAQCPAIQSALKEFHCPLRDVRLLRLAPGSHIREHRDDDLRFDQGEARLHIPLVTHPLVEFYVEGQRAIMEAGECWYLDFSRPHRVRNAGPIERIHLVIDCEVNEWLREQIAQGDVPLRKAPVPSGQDQFFAFRELVWRDTGLQQKLIIATEKAAFVNDVLALGKAHDFNFSADDVESAMTRGRQSWISQWTV
jgi:mannose-6-phosphate isomerase-like protein (cupin superfamily)